jgi:ribosomal protein S18 acetylase RimI-like enzyme
VIRERNAMIRETTATEDSVATQIHALAQSAYALEAERIGCADFPPLRESLDDLRQSSDSFLVFERSGNIIGALSFDRGTNQVTITRLVVSPMHLRQGVATALLADLEKRLSPRARLAVSTAQANTPAIRLYQRLGYMVASVSRSMEGIILVHLTKSNETGR